jgi:O-antigen/teichoic acid export membrane protein
MIEALVRHIRDRIKYGTKAGGLFYYGGSSLVCQGLRFFGILISTRAIAPDQFGKFATTMMVFGLCGLGAELGQNAAFLSCARSDFAYARFHFLMSVALSFLVIFLALVSIALLPGLSDIWPAVPLMSLMVLIDGASQTSALIALKRFEFRRMAIIEIAATATWLICVGLGSAWHPVAMTLIFARTIEDLVRGSSLLAWLYPDLIQGEITQEVRSYYGRFARLLAPQAWVEKFFGNMDILLVKVFTTDTDLGIYERTQQLLRIPLSLSANLVDRVAAASYSREQGSIRLLQRSFAQFISLIALGTIAGLGAVWLFLWLFAGSLLGVEWKNAVSSLWIWAIPFCLLRPIGMHFNNFFQSTSRPRHLLFAFTGMALVLLIAGMVLTPLLGTRGVFLALGASYFVVSLAQTVWFLRLKGQDKSEEVPTASAS